VVVALPEDMLTEAATVADALPYQVTETHPGAAQMAELAQRLQAALAAALAVDTTPIAQAVLAQAADPAKAGLLVAKAIAQARARAVADSGTGSG